MSIPAKTTEETEQEDDQTQGEERTAGPPARKIMVNVDAEQTLDARVARLEELEVLRIAAFQAAEKEGEALTQEDAGKWAGERNRAQRKIGELLNQIHASVKRRFSATNQPPRSKS